MTIVDAKVPWDPESRLELDGLAFPRGEYESRIEKVRRSARVYVNGGTEFGETPGRARVVEMNVAQENVPHIARFEAASLDFTRESFEG